MTTPTLDKLKQQRIQLDARIAAMEAQHKVAERKKETRRKILVGSYYLEQAKKNNTWDNLKVLMYDYLTRDSDRTLFDLPKVTETHKAEREETTYYSNDNNPPSTESL